MVFYFASQAQGKQKTNDLTSHLTKILIPGNHDYGIDALNEDELKAFFPHCTVLVNSGVTVEGINIYGIPWSGHEMSYHVTHETEAMRDKFYIPDDVHILATHVCFISQISFFSDSWLTQRVDTASFVVRFSVGQC